MEISKINMTPVYALMIVMAINSGFCLAQSAPPDDIVPPPSQGVTSKDGHVNLNGVMDHEEAGFDRIITKVVPSATKNWVHLVVVITPPKGSAFYRFNKVNIYSDMNNETLKIGRLVKENGGPYQLTLVITVKKTVFDNNVIRVEGNLVSGGGKGDKPGENPHWAIELLPNIDLDVDSDNNNGLKPLPEAEDEGEDAIEDDSSKPGKLVAVNDSDRDNDFTPDFVDWEIKKPITFDENIFTPMKLTLPAPIDTSKAKIRFKYVSSNTKINKIGTKPEFEYIPEPQGKLRLWTKESNTKRDPKSLVDKGDYLPNDTAFTAKDMGFSNGKRNVTMYIEGIRPSNSVGSTEITAEVDPDGDGPADFMLTDVVHLTIIKIGLTVPIANTNEATKAVPGTPVLLNDDWDGKQKYPASPPVGHHEKEPIWDMDYTDGQVAAEDDLMKTTITVSPATLTGNVTLKITSGGTNVRLWPRATKGVAADIVTIPAAGQAYAISTLPKELYVEGIVLGRAVMTLDYTVGTSTYTDTVNVDVVTLQERQGGTEFIPTRKIINAYNTDMDFAVRLDTLDSHYTYLWDLDGDGTRNSGGAWESGTLRTAKVKYSAAASGAGNVQLVSDAAHNRQEYNITVKLKGGELKGGLVLTRHIRVALEAYRGTAMPAQSTAGLHTIFTWNNTTPVTFDPLPAGDPHDAANRISYDGGLPAGTEAATSYDGVGAARKVLYVTIGAPCWDYNREILLAIVDHEIIHLRQHVAVRDTATSLWRQLDDNYGGAAGYRNFRETEAYLSYLASITVDWRFLTESGKLGFFRDNYNSAVTALPAIGATVRPAAKTFLQAQYDNVPFIEMKRKDYDYRVEAP